MRSPTGGTRLNYLLRVTGIVVLVLVGVYFGNLAVFNAWQSAFPENAPWLGRLELRFWLFILVATVAIGTAVALSILTIRKVNREDREQRQREPVSSDRET